MATDTTRPADTATAQGAGPWVKGSELRPAGDFGMFPRAVLAADWPSPAKVLFIGLADFLRTDELECWPAEARLARRCGMAERTVRKWLTWLRGAGILDWRRTYDGANRYHFLRTGIEPMLHGFTTTGADEASGMSMPHPPARACRTHRHEHAETTGMNVPPTRPETITDTTTRSENMVIPATPARGAAGKAGHASEQNGLAVGTVDAERIRQTVADRTGTPADADELAAMRASLARRAGRLGAVRNVNAWAVGFILNRRADAATVAARRRQSDTPQEWDAHRIADAAFGIGPADGDAHDMRAFCEQAGVDAGDKAQAATRGDATADAAAAAFPEEHRAAHGDLLGVGVNDATALDFARRYDPADVRGWCAEARRRKRLDNPAGFVLSMLMRGERPPPVTASAVDNASPGVAQAAHIYFVRLRPEEHSGITEATVCGLFKTFREREGWTDDDLAAFASSGRTDCDGGIGQVRQNAIGWRTGRTGSA